MGTAGADSSVPAVPLYSREKIKKAEKNDVAGKNAAGSGTSGKEVSGNEDMVEGSFRLSDLSEELL
jgi:hypothetical protein